MKTLGPLALAFGLAVAPAVGHAQTPVPAEPPAPEALPPEVVLGFNPAENAQTLQRSADDLARDLSERIHLRVRATVTLDYTTLVESMRSGHVHFAWLTLSVAPLEGFRAA